MTLLTATTFTQKLLLFTLLGFSVSNTYFLMKSVTKQDASRFFALLSVIGIVSLLLRKNLNFSYNIVTFFVPILYILLREPLEPLDRTSGTSMCEQANVLDSSAECKPSITNEEASKNKSLLQVFCLLAALGFLLVLAKP
jgi:hypothetical protein